MEEIFERIPSSFRIYEEGEYPGLNLKDLKDYLQEKTAIPVYLEGNIYQRVSERIDLMAQKLAQLRIKNPLKGPLPKMVLEGEVNYEKERLKNPNWKSFGILYEGILYQQVLRDFIFKERLNDQPCMILVTNQLIGTWDQNHFRYHIRTSLYGFPHIISIPGLTMGPAKPREFYIKRQMGVPMELLKEEYNERFLEYGDWRITEVLKGYVMQALFYELIGNPFCEDPECRLFNSHWQEEMIRAQLDGAYELCSRHEEILDRVRDRVSIK